MIEQYISSIINPRVFLYITIGIVLRQLFKTLLYLKIGVEKLLSAIFKQFHRSCGVTGQAVDIAVV